ncbi:acid protease [Trichocladium antarcticum]|uniref:Acid protease n=1 Tax=Trichocladium antarcticum TaxID=1450529 RepID=A0AAN6UNP4_9PEZI|nr:acid protease [Trichocladium antarcticum]
MLPLILAAPLFAPAVAAASDARQLVTRGDGIIRSPVNALPASAPKVLGRQNGIDVWNQNSGTRYAVDIEVGTPPQQITLILDTGSPDTWLNPSCKFASASGNQKDCQSFAQFDATQSSSINVTNSGDILVYGSGNATIQYVYETLTIGSATIKDQIIGIAKESHLIPLGILGLSPPPGGRNEYPYVLDTMVDQGVIKSRAFSLDLRGVDNKNGALIFGGIDTGKYIGDLAKLPMLSPRESPRGGDRYYVTMTGVGITAPNGEVLQSEAIGVPVFLDSGGTLSQLPTLIVQALVGFFPDAEYDPKSGFYYLPCDIAEENGTIDFFFGDKAIRVPLNDFIWQIQGFCILGVVAEDEEPILGDTFLRAAYVVFDQDNRNLHIAQAANCDTNLVAIGAGPDAVPSKKGKCTALPTATATATAGSGNLDVSATRAPTNTFTGSGPTDVVVGPGPGATKGSGSGGGDPQATGEAGKNAAGPGRAVGWGPAVALGLVNLLGWML